MQDLRRVVGARCEDDSGGFDRLPACKTDSGGTTVPDQDRVDEGVPADRQVGAWAGRCDVRQKGALPLAVLQVPRQRSDPDAARPVQVVEVGMAGLEASRPDVALEFVQRLTFDSDRAGAAVVGQLAKLAVGLEPVEIWQALVPAPRRRAKRRPGVVVLRLPSKGECGVGGGAAADDASTGDAATCLGVVVVPVELLDAAALPHVSNRVGNVVVGIGPGLEQQHPERGIFTQAAGDDSATGA